MNKKQLHVVKSSNGGWDVKRAGGGVESHHQTQGAAEKSADKTAKQEGGEVVIHGRDGKIRDSDSYGNDPHPPKDKKH